MIDAAVRRLADDRRPTMAGICHSQRGGEVETESDVSGCLQTRRPAQRPRRRAGRQPNEQLSKRPGRITVNSEDTIMPIHSQKASRY